MIMMLVLVESDVAIIVMTWIILVGVIEFFVFNIETGVIQEHITTEGESMPKYI